VTPLTDWADALYLGARTMWPDLTRGQFTAATYAFLARQRGQLRIVDLANGIEAELWARYGDPPEDTTDQDPKITGHRFQAYGWDPERCGYVDGDDWMCGYAENEHGDPVRGGHA
jgi:hypothetical protein